MTEPTPGPSPLNATPRTASHASGLSIELREDAARRLAWTGLPVAIVDQCGRETKGRTLTFHKATDTIQIDGNDRARTQTKGGGASNDKCQ